MAVEIKITENKLLLFITGLFFLTAMLSFFRNSVYFYTNLTKYVSNGLRKAIYSQHSPQIMFSKIVVNVLVFLATRAKNHISNCNPTVQNKSKNPSMVKLSVFLSEPASQYFQTGSVLVV